tara:strand:- start:1016 stop:1636 length:621 start_codon:yes stop_codon:yes gene_type:complete
MITLGYIRVSKNDGSQTLDLQRDALITHGVSKDRIYEDYATGRNDSRPGLNECMKALQPGNTLMIWRLDRLGRNLRDLIRFVEDLNARKVGLKVLSGQGSYIDTTSANGKLIFNIFAALAEFEADLIQERTVAGLTAARARGRLGGRPRKMTRTKLKMAISAMKDPSTKPADIARQLGMTTTTLYDYVNGDGSVKEKGHQLLKLSS